MRINNQELVNIIQAAKIEPNLVKNKLISIINQPEGSISALALLGLIFNITRDIKKVGNLDKNSYLLIINAKITTNDFNELKTNLLIYKDKILATTQDLPEVLPEEADSIIIINAEGMLITPGLIDQHIHGGFGCNFNNANEEEVHSFCRSLGQFGVTSILPTIMTDKEESIKKQIQVINKAKESLSENSSKILGTHLEGPCLCPKYKGIHPEAEILSPSVEFFKKIENPEIKIVSYAPERDSNFELTKYLSQKGIIPSAGHSNATSEEIKQAASHGLKQITHLFNAMAPLHHRNPGIIGASLTNDDLFVEIIADGFHLDPIIVDIVLRTKPDSKVILISDSLPLNNYSQDSIDFGGQKIYKKGGKAVNDSGTMAGSMIFLDSAVNNLRNWKLKSFPLAIKAASFNIAQNLGFANLGSIAKNNIADLVIWNNSYEVNTTIINGKVIFKR